VSAPSWLWRRATIGADWIRGSAEKCSHLQLRSLARILLEFAAMPVPAPLVLVVDDFIDGLELVMDVLTAHGFRAASAEDGPDAIAQARRLRPDLIVMDAALPGIDGWEVTRRLKQDPETQNIPVLMLTANAMPEHAAAARAAGCDAFVTKPVLPDALVAEIRKVIECHQAEAAQPRAAAAEA
jgi:two-component system, cell cycle response regulator DivK